MFLYFEQVNNNLETNKLGITLINLANMFCNKSEKLDLLLIRFCTLVIVNDHRVFFSVVSYSSADFLTLF